MSINFIIHIEFYVPVIDGEDGILTLASNGELDGVVLLTTLDFFVVFPFVCFLFGAMGVVVEADVDSPFILPSSVAGGVVLEVGVALDFLFRPPLAVVLDSLTGALIRSICPLQKGGVWPIRIGYLQATPLGLAYEQATNSCCRVSFRISERGINKNKKQIRSVGRWK